MSLLHALRLYRGMGPPLVGVTPIFALSFWSFDMGKKLVSSFSPASTPEKIAAGKLNLWELAFAGFFSAIPTTLVAGPAERVKVLLQVSSTVLRSYAVSVLVADVHARSRFSGRWPGRDDRASVHRTCGCRPTAVQGGRTQEHLPRNGSHARSFVRHHVLSCSVCLTLDLTLALLLIQVTAPVRPPTLSRTM